MSPAAGACDSPGDDPRLGGAVFGRPSRVFSSKLESMNATGVREVSESEGLEFAGLAERYCELIEASARENRGWLRHVANLLPRLHAAISSVRRADAGAAQPIRVDLDARFELYSRLRLLLADRDGYWLEFDRAGDGAAGMTGSLADDLTDIYCELKAGLAIRAISPESALAAWARGFDWHWGRHLVDAERHLAMLAAQGRLEF